MYYTTIRPIKRRRRAQRGRGRARRQRGAGRRRRRQRGGARRRKLHAPLLAYRRLLATRQHLR